MNTENSRYLLTLSTTFSVPQQQKPILTKFIVEAVASVFKGAEFNIVFNNHVRFIVEKDVVNEVQETSTMLRIEPLQKFGKTSDFMASDCLEQVKMKLVAHDALKKISVSF